MPQWLIYGIGLAAQGFFSARILVQWLMSERARKVLSPTVFWVLSIVGSYLLCIYGWLREDFSIVLGQFISYYVYLWNLKAKGVWTPLPWVAKFFLLLTPPVAMIAVIGHAGDFVNGFLNNPDVPLWLLLFGCTGQVIFSVRFLLQWYLSHKKGKSELPPGFWIMSLTGSVLIVTYGIIRKDPVLILGQSFGLIAYIRNLMIGFRALKKN